MCILYIYSHKENINEKYMFLVISFCIFQFLLIFYAVLHFPPFSSVLFNFGFWRQIRLKNDVSTHHYLVEVLHFFPYFYFQN